LADGADQVVAAAIVEAGGLLNAVLPLEENEYRLNGSGSLRGRVERVGTSSWARDCVQHVHRLLISAHKLL
jgi:hypothetical protein